MTHPGQNLVLSRGNVSLILLKNGREVSCYEPEQEYEGMHAERERERESLHTDRLAANMAVCAAEPSIFRKLSKKSHMNASHID